MPIFIERSKEEVAHLYRPRMVPELSPEIASNISEVMSYFKGGEAPKKRKAEDSEISENKDSKVSKISEPVDDDEDIFDDV